MNNLYLAKCPACEHNVISHLPDSYRHVAQPGFCREPGCECKMSYELADAAALIDGGMRHREAVTERKAERELQRVYMAVALRDPFISTQDNGNEICYYCGVKPNEKHFAYCLYDAARQATAKKE